MVFEGGLGEIMNGTRRSTGSVTLRLIRIQIFWGVTLVIGFVPPDVSSNVFQVLGCLPFKMTAIRNAGNHPLDGTVSQCRRFESSTTLF